MTKDDFYNCRYSTVKAISVVFAIYLVLFVVWCILTAPNGDRIVYTTRTGECYHQSGCSSLRYSKYKTTIEKAVADGYRRCGNCGPPKLIDGDVKLDLSISSIPTIIFGSLSLSFFIWMISISLFHFFDIPEDQIKLKWYPISAAVFLVLVLFI